MCVCVFSSHSFWTSSSLDVPAGVTQEEGHTGFLIHLLSAVHALIFIARRIQPFLSLVDREVEFCIDDGDPLLFTWYYIVRSILYLFLGGRGRLRCQIYVQQLYYFSVSAAVLLDL